MSEATIADGLVGDFVSSGNDSVTRSDAIVHLVPECIHSRAVLVGCTEGRSSVHWTETRVVGVPRFAGEVVGVGELVCSIESDAVCPFVTEVPTDIAIEGSSECLESFGCLEVLCGILGGEVFIEEVTLAGGVACQNTCAKHRSYQIFI